MNLPKAVSLKLPNHTSQRYIPILIGVLYLLLATVSIFYDDITYDEQDHLNYGIRILKGKSSRQQVGADFNTTMPISALNALPRAVEQLMNDSLEKKDGGAMDVKRGRFITVLATLLLLGYFFAFGKAIAGFAAGCWAMFLGAVDPNILAHSRLVTTDLYGTLAFVAVLFHLYQWQVKKSSPHFYFWCIALAFAQCCKVNNILLYPICLFIILGYRFSQQQIFSWRVFFQQFAFFVFIHLLLINAAFLFYHTGMALEEYQFRSAFFQQLKQSWIGGIPVPLPQSYIDGFDLTQFERESFTGTAQNYLLGELRYKEGFWTYYIFCWFVKTPLLTQILILIAIFAALRNKRFRKPLLFFFLLPSLVVLIFLSSSSVQSGYRYLLPVLSLSLISAGVLIKEWIQQLPRFSGIILCVVLAIPAFMNFQNFIAYTSEWLWPKKNAYRYLSDSNLNWGQRQKQIGTVLKNNPQFIFEPPEPVTGLIVVDINKLTGIIEPKQFAWLREHYEPVTVIEGTYLLFDVKELP